MMKTTIGAILLMVAAIIDASSSFTSDGGDLMAVTKTKPKAVFGNAIKGGNRKLVVMMAKQLSPKNWCVPEYGAYLLRPPHFLLSLQPASKIIGSPLHDHNNNSSNYLHACMQCKGSQLSWLLYIIINNFVMCVFN